PPGVAAGMKHRHDGIGSSGGSPAPVPPAHVCTSACCISAACQDVARVVIAHSLLRLVERMPNTRCDPLGFFRHGVAAPRFEEKEMAVLVNRLAAEAEVPIDHFYRAVEHELVESGFLGHLAPRPVGGRLGGFEVALGKSPILVRVANQQEAHLAVGATTENHAAGACFALGA